MVGRRSGLRTGSSAQAATGTISFASWLKSKVGSLPAKQSASSAVSVRWVAQSTHGAPLAGAPLRNTMKTAQNAREIGPPLA
jgi:hypothetical protein